MNKLAPYYKAYAAAITAGLVTALTVLTGNETWADVTTAERILVALSVLGAGGVTYAVPNKPKS